MSASKKNSSSLRLIAARIIDDVTSGRSLADCLEPRLKQIQDPRDRAFVQALCYGVCRFYTRLDVTLSHLLKKPMQAKDSDVHALLLVGLYQLIEMRVPAHAAVSETVEATAGLKKSWARGFVNAILREYLRTAATSSVIASVAKQSSSPDPEALYAHPQWWIDAIKKAWPEQWEAILHANNEHPPMSLRVNQQRQTREQYLEKLKSESMDAFIMPETSCGLMLQQPAAVESLPGFSAGHVFVQDGAAQLAAELMQLSANQHVLDACAAPGGKLTHLLEVEPTLSVVAVEKDKIRMQAIKENLDRLSLKAECLCADAAATSEWWDGKLFDRILLDAPCSASGVIRRHPDIKLLREAYDIKALEREQAQLLEALWLLLKPGGMLVYATCSIFPAENSELIQAFLAKHPEAQEEKLNVDWGVACAVGRQILPGMHGMDGFYYARLRKLS